MCVCVCVCGGGAVGGGSKKLTLSLLVLRELSRQNFAYFFHLHYVLVERQK